MTDGEEMPAIETVMIARDFGRHLIGRDIGVEIRRRHFSGKPATWPRGLDFTGVEQATESCIDELLGTLARDQGLPAVENIKISGATGAVSETIAYVFSILRHPPAVPDPQVLRNLLRRNGQNQRRRRDRPKTSGRARHS